jgi:hypothetical protein
VTVGQGGVGLGVGEGGTPRIIKKSLPPKMFVMTHARGGEGDGVCGGGKVQRCDRAYTQYF